MIAQKFVCNCGLEFQSQVEAQRHINDQPDDSHKALVVPVMYKDDPAVLELEPHSQE